ncbi:segregation and condensation protein A [Lichenicola sp.]|uniref:segregation and condensation protein A n=1 Tax=Lichenicola sp. TaxID=2804529 RepID=UPI003B00B5D0
MSESSNPAPMLQLDGFEGPLDLLLELARTQKLDLAAISILQLVEQYLAAVEQMRLVRLEIAADWLVMAAWLTWLKSRLLLPDDETAAEEGEEAAELLQARLLELARVGRAAEWLQARPQLGREVFRRGAPEDLREIDRSGLSLDLGQLLSAYLATCRRTARRRVYRPRPPTFWSVQDALLRLQAMLGDGFTGWCALERFLPVAGPASGERQVRAALAGTLLAGLELARSGTLEVRQDEQFGPILLRRPAPMASADVVPA